MGVDQLQKTARRRRIRQAGVLSAQQLGINTVDGDDRVAAGGQQEGDAHDQQKDVEWIFELLGHITEAAVWS